MERSRADAIAGRWTRGVIGDEELMAGGGKKLAEQIRKHAMSYPEVVEDHPWGESAFKVKKKVFVFMHEGDEMSFSCKLPKSRDFALSFPFAEPTHYGLGKSGWVTFKIDRNTKIDLKLVRAFIDESFRAIAPRKLVDTL